MEVWQIASIVTGAFGAGGLFVWVRFAYFAPVERAGKMVDIQDKVIERLEERLDALEQDYEDLHEEHKRILEKMGRWEAKFRELGIDPPNGHDHDISGVPI